MRYGLLLVAMLFSTPVHAASGYDHYLSGLAEQQATATDGWTPELQYTGFVNPSFTTYGQTASYYVLVQAYRQGSGWWITDVSVDLFQGNNPPWSDYCTFTASQVGLYIPQSGDFFQATLFYVSPSTNQVTQASNTATYTVP